MKMEAADSIESLVLITRLYDVTFLKTVSAVSKTHSTPVRGWIHADDTGSAFRGFSAVSSLNDCNTALAFHPRSTLLTGQKSLLVYRLRKGTCLANQEGQCAKPI